MLANQIQVKLLSFPQTPDIGPTSAYIAVLSHILIDPFSLLQ